MNKKMREILAKIEKKRLAAQTLLESDKGIEAAALLDEIRALQSEYETAKALYELEKTAAPEPPKADDTINGFEVIAKLVSKKPLTEAENALITGGGNGENLLIPEDVRLAIIELRKQYKSAKPLCNIIPTTTLTGSFNFEKGGEAGLVSFTDGEDIPTSNEPQFVQKKFDVKFKGKLIPVSNILLGAEQAGLMSYLNTWFVRGAIVSENKDIFAKLKEGKTAKTLKGWAALKSSLNLDIDPSARIGSVIVTNQTGFDILDSAADANGRPILQVDIAAPTKKLFQGFNVEVFSDAELPNISNGKAPVFYGNLKAGVYFIDKMTLEFASSEHFYFGKNQLALRVIEGYDIIGADTNAYMYGTLEKTDDAPAAG